MLTGASFPVIIESLKFEGKKELSMPFTNNPMFAITINPFVQAWMVYAKTGAEIGRMMMVANMEAAAALKQVTQLPKMTATA